MLGLLRSHILAGLAIESAHLVSAGDEDVEPFGQAPSSGCLGPGVPDPYLRPNGDASKPRKQGGMSPATVSTVPRGPKRPSWVPCQAPSSSSPRASHLWNCPCPICRQRFKLLIVPPGAATRPILIVLPQASR